MAVEKVVVVLASCRQVRFIVIKRGRKGQVKMSQEHASSYLIDCPDLGVQAEGVTVDSPRREDPETKGDQEVGNALSPSYVRHCINSRAP